MPGGLLPRSPPSAGWPLQDETNGLSPGRGSAAQPGARTHARRHSPMWQAPVSGSQAPSWQLQASAQLAP